MSWLMRLMGTTNNGEVDSQGQQRVIPYDASGNSLAPVNRSAVNELAGGQMMGGKDYKISRTARMSSTGGVHIAGDGTIMLWDSVEGTTRNLNQWVETLATATSAQTLVNGLRLNTTGSVTSGQGVLETSHRHFPILARAALVFRARLRVQGLTNCFEEFGFGAPTDATTAVVQNGAFFRRDGAGTVQAILAFGGAEGAGPSMTAPATTDTAWYEIFLEDDHALFQIVSVTGVLLSSQVMERGATGGSGTGVAAAARLFNVTHIPCFFRVYNSGAAGTAPQIDMTHCSVTMADAWSQRDHRVMLSGLGLNSLSSPTAFTQLANWTNSGAPTTRTLSNTVAAEVTLGGLLRVNSIAGGPNIDYIMFAWTNPSPYTFYCTRITIPVPINEVVAIATTPTMYAYFAAFNSSADSLATAAPYSPMRVALGGSHLGAIALAANAYLQGENIVWTPGTPMAVQPARRLHIGCRLLLGTATATETFLWPGVSVDGFFE